MAYEYEFEDLPLGTQPFPRSYYETLQDGLVMLRDELIDWNEFAKEHGAPGIPYEREVADLSRMIDEGLVVLAPDGDNVRAEDLSLGSMCYMKAAAGLLIRRCQDALLQKDDGVPGAVWDSVTEPLYELEDFLRSVHNSSGPCGVLFGTDLGRGAGAGALAGAGGQ